MRGSLTIVIAVLLLGACSGDDDDAAPTTAAQGEGGDDDEYVEATAAALRDDTEDLDFDLDRDQATCFATGLVDVVGVDALTEAGISPDEFAGADSFADLDVDVPDDAGTRLAAACPEAAGA
jgi:hypothetical protein